MKVLMLSWEFPPRIVGGISTHVFHLSRALARRVSRIHVLTCDFPGAKPKEIVDGVQVSRVDSSRVSQTDFLLWTYFMNSLMIEEGSEMCREVSFDLIHAHDWIVGRASLELKSRFGVPLITTVHATEIGRSGGVHNSYQKTIHGIEDFLIQNSERIICCSKYMLRHVQENFCTPSNKMELVPNAVDPTIFNHPSRHAESAAKTDWRRSDSDRKIILYVGRLVTEKGLDTLIDAFEKLQRKRADTSLVIVGEGPLKESLMAKVQKRRLHGHVRFVGLIDEASLANSYRSSDVFVLPSLYEPFGIAALEAMASSVPVVVSDSGGLSEIVENGVTGVKVPAGDAVALAFALNKVLEDTSFADHLAENAYHSIVQKYNWDSVAEKTIQAYNRTLEIPARSVALPDEDLLTELGLISLLFTLGATRQERARTAPEIADFLGAPEVSLKLILGRLASRAYVSIVLNLESSTGVGYYLTQSGIIKACAGFS